jgi:hypothetical protein
MISEEEIRELQAFCRNAREVQQGGEGFLYLEGLRLPPGRQPPEVDAVLCLHAREGYSTRLYLSAMVADRGSNWSSVYLLDRRWHTWSWQGVPPNHRPSQVLAAHLKALQ